MKIAKFSKNPTPLVHLRPSKIVPTHLTLDVQFQANPPSSPNDNQSIKKKHNQK